MTPGALGGPQAALGDLPPPLPAAALGNPVLLHSWKEGWRRPLEDRFRAAGVTQRVWSTGAPKLYSTRRYYA